MSPALAGGRHLRVGHNVVDQDRSVHASKLRDVAGGREQVGQRLLLLLQVLHHGQHRLEIKLGVGGHVGGEGHVLWSDRREMGKWSKRRCRDAGDAVGSGRW